jgi:hypothetical protein
MRAYRHTSFTGIDALDLVDEEIPETGAKASPELSNPTPHFVAFPASLRLLGEPGLPRGVGHRFPVAARLSVARHGEDQSASGLGKPW